MNKKQNLHKQNGSVLILTAFVLLVLVAIAAFVIDFGNFYLRKTELKNTADAAAIAGVVAVYRGQYGSNWETDPNITLYVRNALEANNYADYASYTPPRGPWKSIDTDLGITVDNPAVKVTLTGRAPFFFAQLFGINDAGFTVSSTGVTGPPASIQSTLPLVVADCAVIGGFDAFTGTPKIDLATGEPYIFTLGSSGTPVGDKLGCSGLTGLWSSLSEADVPSNSNIIPYIPQSTYDKKTKITTWSTPPSVNLSVPESSKVNTSNGALSDAYSNMQNCFTNYSYCQKKLIFGIIGTPGHTVKGGYLDIAGTGAPTGTGTFPIVGFVCVKINSVNVSGSNSYITGQFAQGCVTSGTMGTGEYYGVAVPPVLGR